VVLLLVAKTGKELGLAFIKTVTKTILGKKANNDINVMCMGCITNK
jgi:hypothetical protein